MKNFILFILIFSSLAALKAQQTCATSLNLTSASTCNYSTHITTGTEYWLKFTATSPTVNISLITVKFGINATHIHNLALYSGNCSSPILVADDELPFVADAKELAIDLNASGLVIGQTYYLKASRIATHTSCDKSGCTSNGSADPTVFDVCVQDINVIIPKDFGLELPAISHAYTTNRGQLVNVNGNPVPQIKLYNDQTNPAVYIADDKISYVFSRIDTSITSPDTLHRVDVSLVGSTPTKAFKTEQTAGITNYYLGHIPQGITNNKSYSRVVCNEVYPNIDLQYYSNPKGLKYYFIVKPGGDPDNIILKFDGATAINVTPTGGLEIVTSIGTLDFEPPHAYRVNPAGNIVPMPWQAKFEAIPASANTVKFKTHPYDPIMPLFIQIDRGHSLKGPSDPEWSTYFGGSGNDFGYDITNDNNGNVFVVGETKSVNFPVSFGASQGINLGSKDGFLAKFDVNYERKFSTYYGGGGDEPIRALTYSKFDDKIYISGEIEYPQPPYITTQSSNVNSFVSTQVDYNTTFLARFNQLGLREWATYFGGAYTIPTKLATDNIGNLYVVGYSTNYNSPSIGCTAPTSYEFPICNSNNGSYIQSWINGGFNFGDGFIAKFNATNELTWSTFIGGNNDDAIYDVVFDEQNQHLIIGGFTKSSRIGAASCSPGTSLPICNKGSVSAFLLQDLKGVADGFITKFNTTNRIVYSTYFGGYGDDAITGVAVTSTGDTYVTGYSNTFQNGAPTCTTPTNGGFPFCASSLPAYSQNQNGTSYDSFIARFDESNGLNWSTFLGGDKDELFGSDVHRISKIVVNSNNDIIAVGNTLSGTSGSTVPFPISNLNTSLFLSANHNDNSGAALTDTYVSLFDGNTNELMYSSYLGGKGTDHIGNVTAFQGRIYVTGGTVSAINFPINCPTALFPNPFCQQTFQGGVDVFITQLRLEGFVGVEDNINLKNEMVIYPNPTNSNITVRLDKKMLGRDVMLEVHDILGKLTYKKPFFNQQIDEIIVNAVDFPNGMYLIKLQAGLESYSAKFIKQ
ncbi:MAG: SBBP repeat-containing protein [Flavobacteriales bacterium]|nr:SBBP repeat-containing protein [Flavobacteriales bacterium]